MRRTPRQVPNPVQPMNSAHASNDPTLTAPMRAMLGFAAAALSVLTFHQLTWALLHAVGLWPLAPYPTDPVPPFGVPRIINAAFWGGLYGIPLGLAVPWLRRTPLWLAGLLVGVLAVLVLWLVVQPLKGQPVGGGAGAGMMLASALIHAAWGLGLGLLLPLLMGRRRVPAHA
jgi:hypothetical protein